MTERTYATGRRKESTARVWLQPGNGKITINKRELENFLPRPSLQMILKQPLTLTETHENYDVVCTVRGGGMSGQAGAIRHGIAQAIAKAQPELRGQLKKAGHLTRDAREVERKKYGQPGARKRFQFSKR